MKNKIRKYAPPLVDIVTATYGGLNFIKGLAQSLLIDFEAGVSFSWTIIDDATPEDLGRKELIEYLRELEKSDERVKVIEQRINGGYAKSNNLAASRGRAKYLLLLNSDTRIMENDWLKKLTNNLDETEAITIVGPKLLFFPESTDKERPAGAVQSAGTAFNILGHPYHIFIGWPSDHPKVNEKRIMRAVTGACLLIRRNAWRAIGGLAEIYDKGNFEDVELCVRLIAKGGIVLYDPSVTLYHYGSGSNNTETIKRNSQIFMLRNTPLLVWDDYMYF